MARQIITLTTDFGLADAYVGSVKGVILSINPEATLVDISHEVLPQRIEQGAFLLGSAYGYFPTGSIHLAVVDPGVGTDRRPILLATPKGLFVGPDNGVLSAALPDDCRAWAESGGRVRLPEGVQAFVLENDHYHRTPVSATFHARDIFGPVAAHLSLGVAAEEFGPEKDEIVALPPFRATEMADGTLIGTIMHIDRYGNLISSVRVEQLTSRHAKVEVRGRSIEGLTRTFADCDGLAAIIGSSGFLGIALNRNSAASEIGAAIGDTVTVRLA